MEAGRERDVIIVRYADDAVIGFQDQHEAERFVKELRQRLSEYGLELNEEKTRLLRFGPFWDSGMFVRRTARSDLKSGE